MKVLSLHCAPEPRPFQRRPDVRPKALERSVVVIVALGRLEAVWWTNWLQIGGADVVAPERE